MTITIDINITPIYLNHGEDFDGYETIPYEWDVPESIEKEAIICSFATKYKIDSETARQILLDYDIICEVQDNLYDEIVDYIKENYYEIATDRYKEEQEDKNNDMMEAFRL